MPAFIDMKGWKFFRLTVLRRSGRRRKRHIHWLCMCTCGKKVTIAGGSLREGRTKSCGCFNREKNITHGLSKTVEYRLWSRAKHRAKRRNLYFTISLTDIVIPENCPVFGTPIHLGNKKLSDSSPTLDRFVPEKGYIKGNVFVISYRANRLKSDMTKEELKHLLKYMQKGA